MVLAGEVSSPVFTVYLTALHVSSQASMWLASQDGALSGLRACCTCLLQHCSSVVAQTASPDLMWLSLSQLMKILPAQEVYMAEPEPTHADPPSTRSLHG